jgi:hypothetical protein
MGEQPLSPKRPPSNGFLRYSGMAIQMALTIGLFVWIGLQLDSHFSAGKTYTLIGSLLGVVVAMFRVIKDLTRT